MSIYQQTTCRYCKKTFNALVYNLRKGFGKHCSKACSNKANNLGFKKGHKGHLTPEIYKANGEKISKAKKGIRLSEEHMKALSESQFRRWDKIGRRPLLKDRRTSYYKYRWWREKVFKRDDYTCQVCKIRGIYLEADHIMAWSKFPKLRYKVSNGKTLCQECHKQTHNYKSKARKQLSSDEYEAL